MITNAEQLRKLYYDEGLTLQEIGNSFGVTREYIRQLMERFGIPRDTKRVGRRGSSPHFQGLEDYLIRGKQYNATIRKYLPVTVCSECGATEKLQIHHIHYPAYSIDDIQILCRWCHWMKHYYKMTLVKQLDLYSLHLKGTPAKQLAQQYDISLDLVYKLIVKIKNGYRTLRR